MRPPIGIGWLTQQRAYDIGWNRRVLTNLSPGCRSCPITFRAEVIPYGYTGTQRDLLTVTSLFRGASSTGAPSCRSRLALRGPALPCRSLRVEVFGSQPFEHGYSLQHVQTVRISATITRLRHSFSFCSSTVLMGFSLCTIEQSQAFGGDIVMSLFCCKRKSPLGRYDNDLRLVRIV